MSLLVVGIYYEKENVVSQRWMKSENNLINKLFYFKLEENVIFEPRCNIELSLMCTHVYDEQTYIL